MNIKRQLATIVVFIMVIAMCSTACTTTVNTTLGNTTTSGNTTSMSSAVTDADPFAEKVDLVMCLYGPDYDVVPLNDTEFERILEERFNCTISVVPLEGSNAEQFNIYFSSGEKADVIRVWERSRLNNLIKQEVIREIDPQMYYDNMPEHTAYVVDLCSAADPTFTFENIPKTFGISSVMYGIPYPPVELNSYPMVYRKDWASAVGITEVPKSIDDFEEMALAIIAGDPAGTNPCGFSNYWGSIGFQYFFTSFGIPGAAYYVDDSGKVYNTMASDALQQFYVKMNEWYKLGIIDPEFGTDDRNAAVAKWSTGKTFSITNNTSWFWKEVGNNMYDIVKDNYPDAEIEMLEGLSGPGGAGGSVRNDITRVAHSHQTAFGYDTTDAQVMRYMAILESFADSLRNDPNMEWYLEGMYGPYGQFEDGLIKQQRADHAAEIAEKGWCIFSDVPALPELQVAHPQSKLATYVSFKAPALPNGHNFITGGSEPIGFEQITADLGTTYSEYMIWFIDGTKDPVADWAEYIDLLTKAGNETIVAEWQAIYDANN